MAFNSHWSTLRIMLLRRVITHFRNQEWTAIANADAAGLQARLKDYQEKLQ